MQTVSGGCHCGNISLELELTRAPDSYSPRACDCDFCRKHSAQYVSDPQGSLVIRLKREADCGRYRQGSGLAECLLCRNCGVLIGAIYQNDTGLYATINVKTIDARVTFGAEQSVSPKQLSESEKVKRWQDLWFCKVQIESAR
jgi:hypothetical protein